LTASPPNRTPVIIGFLIAGAALIGASFLVGTLADDPPNALPPLHIAAPASGDTLRDPVTIEFRTPAALALDPAMGWTAGELHLHAMVGGREIMPAAADITARGGLWTWRLPALGSGSHRLYLTWAGRHHGNLAGPTDTLVIHIQP
jgi:hypothetical protein